MSQQSQQQKSPVKSTAQAAAEDPALQGEGNYTATRRHRKSVEKFVESGQVASAAREAAPQSAAEEKALLDAEQQGRSHAKR